MNLLDALVVTTNEVVGLQNPKLADLWKVCVIGCKALQMLSEDKEFFDQFEAHPETSASLSDEIKKTFEDLSQFEIFLEIEKKILIEAGIEASVAASILEQAGTVRRQIKSLSADPGTVRDGISKLCNETCYLAEKLGQLADTEERWARARNLLQRVAWAIGGATIIVVDVKGSIVIGPLYTGASISIGKALVVNAIMKASG